MTKIDPLTRGLIKWCESERARMTHDVAMMKAGELRLGSSDGRAIVDETDRWIIEIDRRVKELDDLLADISSGAI